VELAKAGGAPGLNAAALKWARWPRIAKAAVLADRPQASAAAPPGAQWFDLHLLPGQTDQFSVHDLVRLRTRPLLPAATESGELRVVGIRLDQPAMIVEPLSGGSLNPNDYPAGSILFAPRRDAAGQALSLVAPVIHVHLDGPLGGPLNRPPPQPGVPHECSRDDRRVQPARNLPAGLRRGWGFRSYQVLGAYEGGAGYYCGAYHPSGACLMRTLTRVQALGVVLRLSRFCHVCRYVLVDRLDPSQHGAIDALYEREYPRLASDG
jgi:hypothetical protein